MDLIEALEAANIEYHQGRDDDEIYICCPFCTDQRFRLGINVVSGRSGCFNDTCEWRGYGEYTFAKLQEVLDTGEIESKQHERKRKRVHEKVELPEGFELLTPDASHGDHWEREAWSYIRKRGIPREQIKEKKIGYTVLGPLAYRIIFPVYINGILVGISGRDFTGKQDPPHKNSIGQKCLYNIPDKKHSSVCLSEATITALAIEHGAKRLGIDSIGLLGHSLKDDQLSLLKHYKKVYIWLDPDKAGIEGLVGKNNGSGIYTKLQSEGKSIKVILPKGLFENTFDTRDPDELDTIEITHRLERAMPMTDSLLQKLRLWMVSDESR